MTTLQDISNPLNIAWCITCDKLTPGGQPGSRAGKVVMKSGATFTVDPAELIAFTKRKGMTAFRLFDDDGEHYYCGRINRDWLDGDESTAFAPLDWAMADAGATTMKYANERGEFVQL